MKYDIDRKRVEREFKIGDWVYLRLRPYRQMTVALLQNLKFSPKYYSPSQVINWIYKVAYKLNLPIDSQIYPVFHVSFLNKKLGPHINLIPNLPSIMSDGTLSPKLNQVLAKRMEEKGTQGRVDILIQWKGATPEDATWEDLDELR